MGSMNNWLAFSLSPQEQLPSSQGDDHQDHQSQNNSSHVCRLGFNSSDEISAANDVSAAAAAGHCFDLTSHDSTTLPPPFDIFEAFNRNNPSQDWNMKGAADMGNPSMLMGDPCSHHQEPKLENFLGGHSFGDHDHKIAAYNGDYSSMFSNNCSSLQLPSDSVNVNETRTTDNGDGNVNGMNNNSSIGLSMIKTWLRNQPAPTTTQPTNPPLDVALENKNNNNTGGAAVASNGAQTLSLSMSSGGESSSSDNLSKQQLQLAQEQQKAVACLDSQTGAIEAVPRKSIDTFGQRTSIYRGVTRHRWTGRYEAHLWDNSCRREGQTRKGRQVYLGGYDKEEKAARAYDLAALKYWGPTTTTNFPISDYEKELEEMKHMTRQEFVASLRRKSSGFSRGASIYRGVTRHHQHGRWQARIGRVAGNKDLYLGTFSTQEEAAEAYDIAAIKFRGTNAVTNFEISRYDVKSIIESSTLPIGGAAKRLKDIEQADLTVDGHRTDNDNMSPQLSDVNNYGWPTIAAYQQPQPAVFGMHHHPYAQRFWCKQEQEGDSISAHNFQHLQLGNTHNFFMHQNNNYMNVDTSSMEHNSSSSSSVVYGGDHHHVQGGSSTISYGNVIPMSTIVASDHGNSNQNPDQNGYGDGGEVNVSSMDSPYHARNLYYLSQHQQSVNNSAAGVVKATVYDHQGSTCNSWVPTAVPAIASKSAAANMALVHGGAPTFTVWNDT